MMFETSRRPRNIITLVVRLWPPGSAGERHGYRYQATHVRTGEVAYFQSDEGLIGYLEHLREQVIAGTAQEASEPEGDV